MKGRVEQLYPTISKCYEDLAHFKDLSAEMITTFKYEIIFEQEKLLRNIGELQRDRLESSFKVEKTNELLQ